MDDPTRTPVPTVTDAVEIDDLEAFVAEDLAEGSAAGWCLGSAGTFGCPSSASSYGCLT